MAERLAQLNQIFQGVFEDDSIAVSRETTAKDVEGWDSLMHVTLVINIEKAFGIKFNSSEVAGFKNVGELIDAIDRRLPA